MQQLDTVDARSFYAAFARKFADDAASGSDDNPVSISYRKFHERRRQSPGATRDPKGDYREWTHVMSIFLAQLARRNGLFQEWEWRCHEWEWQWIDYVWVSDLRPDPRPLVAIEHENDPAREDESSWMPTRKSCVDKAVLKFARERVPLGVVITYPWGAEDANRIVQNCLETLRGSSIRGEILLLFGGVRDQGTISDPGDWVGWVWNGDGFEPIGPL